MTDVWFTADNHFGHEAVAKLRGGFSVEEHDEWLVEKWNATVKPRDIVWHLGDVGSGPHSHRRLARDLAIVATLHGEKHLVAGNHEACHSMYRDAHKFQREYLEVFASIQMFARRRIQGKSVMLSHFPYRGDHVPVDRFDQYRLRIPPEKEGGPLLCGHVHDAWERFDLGLVTPQINVGVDVREGRPMHLDEVWEAFYA